MDTSKARSITEGYSFGKNVYRIEMPRGSILYSYGTPVAIRLNSGLRVHGETYSVTTRKHITMHMPGTVKAGSPPFEELLRGMFAN